MRNKLLHGDVLDQLQTLLDQAVNCIVTSPPYFGLRDYGLPPTKWPAVSYAPMPGLPEIMAPEMSCCLGLEDSIESYVGHLVLVFRELWRVLRADGVAWLNLGDSYFGSQMRGGTDSKEGVGKLKDRMFDRPKITSDLKPKDLMAIPWRVALALQAEGWYLRSDVIWDKPNGLPESVTDRPTKSHEYVFLLSKSARYWYDAEAIREKGSNKTIATYPQPDKAARANITTNGTGKSSLRLETQGRNARTVWRIPTAPFKQAHFAVFPPALVERCLLAGCPSRVCVECGSPWVRVVEKGFTDHTGETKSNYGDASTANRLAKLRQAARANGEEYTNQRKTIGFTPSCQCCPLPNWTPPDKFGDRWPVYYAWRPGVVLDPFFGSGTTGTVAKRLGRDWLGIDLNPEYAKMARKRLGKTQPALPGIF